MSYALPVTPSQDARIESRRVECKARHEAGDPAALDDYRSLLLDIFGEERGKKLIAGEAHHYVPGMWAGLADADCPMAPTYGQQPPSRVAHR